MHALRCFTRSRVALLVAVVVLLACATTGQASPTPTTPPPRQALRPPDARDSAERWPWPPQSFRLIPVVPDRPAPATEVGEFHMRDAAIGAGAATGLILLTAGMVRGLRHRHRQEVFSVVIQRSL